MKTLAAFLLLVTSAFAHEIGPNDVALPTHGGDPIPRASKRWTNVLVVPAGETVTRALITEAEAQIAGWLREISELE